MLYIQHLLSIVMVLDGLRLMRKCKRYKLFAESMLLSVECSAPRSEVLKTICRWNHQRLLLHPRTCLEIRKSIRKEVVDDVSVTTESCHMSDVDEDAQTGQRVNTVQIIYNEVADAGFLGKTLFELQVCCDFVLTRLHCVYFLSYFHYCYSYLLILMSRIGGCVNVSFGTDSPG